MTSERPVRVCSTSHGREPKPQQMREVLEIDPRRDLARPGHPFAKDVSDFRDAPNSPSAEDFEENLVAERAHLDPGDRVASNDEVPAHRVAHAADNPREGDQPHELSPSRERPPNETPIAHSSTVHMAAADGEVRATFDGSPQLADDFRGMLQIGVDDSERLPSGHLPTPNDGGRQAVLATPPHDPQRGKRLRELDRNRPRSIGTVVVDDDELVVPRKRLIERCREALEEGSQIGRFVIGWNHQR